MPVLVKKDPKAYKRYKKRLDTLILLYQTYAFNMVTRTGFEPVKYSLERAVT